MPLRTALCPAAPGPPVRRQRVRPRAPHGLIAVALWALLSAHPVLSGTGGTQGAAVAIIVNAKNDTPDPSFSELQAMLTLDRQFWPSGHRLVLYLPPADSPEKQALLETIYAMSDSALRQLWVVKLFRGAIPAIPSSLRTRAAVVNAVQQSEGAISAILATEVPAGVRVLKIDGKLPADPGYPLVLEVPL